MQRKLIHEYEQYVKYQLKLNPKKASYKMVKAKLKTIKFFEGTIKEAFNIFILLSRLFEKDEKMKLELYTKPENVDEQIFDSCMTFYEKNIRKIEI